MGNSRWLVTECPPVKERTDSRLSLSHKKTPQSVEGKNEWKALKLWRLSFNGRHLRVSYFGEGKNVLFFLFFFIFFYF